jgi:hypothetical protein
MPLPGGDFPLKSSSIPLIYSTFIHAEAWFRRKAPQLLFPPKRDFGCASTFVIHPIILQSWFPSLLLSSQVGCRDLPASLFRQLLREKQM